MARSYSDDLRRRVLSTVNKHLKLHHLFSNKANMTSAHI